MQITDTIADLLTRIRNANTAKHATVDVPASRVKKDITQILVDEGYVKGFQLIEGRYQDHTEIRRQQVTCYNRPQKSF